MATTEFVRRRISVGNIELDVSTGGEGEPLLFIPSEEGRELDSSLVHDLAQHHSVYLLSPPGFGRSERPDWISNPDDLSYICLDLIDAMALKAVAVVGFSLGGWIAAEMAVKNDSAISKLALVDPYGVKIGGPFDVDIQDIWTSHPDKVAALKWHDQEKGKRDFTAMNDDELSIVARNLESFARFGWDPYMHNPKLKQRLHRIKTPTLFIWGENDGIVTPAYGRAYAGLVPGAKFASIPDAGHYPHIEQPAAFKKILSEFLG